MNSELLKAITGKDGVPMVLIPAGEFSMGSPENEGENKEHPQHKIYSDVYYIDKYVVTNEQYAKFLNVYGKDTDDNGVIMIYYDYSCEIEKYNGRWQPVSGYEKHPAVYVSWYGAKQYAKYYGKCLPTEAEWEKACRAESNTRYCFGDNENELGEYAWYGRNLGRKTHPVGTKKPNKWGIYDMHGNVWEWCSDWYSESYYSSSSGDNPKGPDSGTYRVIRGGSWCSSASRCRSAYRGKCNLPGGFYGLGFRCVVRVIQEV